MKSFITFLKTNAGVLVGITLGIIAGYLYWYHFGCQWGTYPLSAECWINCTYGGIFGGYLACLIRNPIVRKSFRE